MYTVCTYTYTYVHRLPGEGLVGLETEEAGTYEWSQI